MHRILFILLAAGALLSAQAPKPKAADPKPAPAKVAPAPAPAAAPKAGAILGNKDSKTYHRADCKVAAKMKEANRQSFASAADAAKAGFKPCKVCKP